LQVSSAGRDGKTASSRNQKALIGDAKRIMMMEPAPTSPRSGDSDEAEQYSAGKSDKIPA
jgi:hypothetical protein